VLAKAKIIKVDKKNINIDEVLKYNDNVERSILISYGFWLDIYQLKLFDNSYNNKDIVIEYQYSTFIRESEKGKFNSEKEKYYWNGDERRIKKVKLEMTSDIYQVPYAFIRIKVNRNFSLGESYIGYIKIDLCKILNKLEVRPAWIKLRRCETNLNKIEDPNNYIGELLFAFNVFVDENQISKRPALLDKINFKKFILFSRIYMGKNFPKMTKDKQAFCEVQFYNSQSKEIKTQGISDSTNPNWSETLLNTVKLNENLEFSRNLRLIAKISNEVIGETEIPVNTIEVYRDSNQIETEIFKKAKWYTLEDINSDRKCYILARFMLIMSHKIEKEDLSFLKNLKLNPNKIKSYFMFFIIGIRNLSECADKGFIRIKYDEENLEETKQIKEKNDEKAENKQIEKKKYLFNNTKNSDIYSYNYLLVIKTF